MSENVIIKNEIPPTDQGKREIDIKDINMENQKEISEEIDRLKKFTIKWNIHADPKPPPLHIKWEDYGSERRAEFQAAKDAYYRGYTKTCQDLINNLKKLREINTELCFNQKKEEDEIKIKEGTFYNAEEQEYLNQQIEERAESRKEANAKYYENNKEKLKKKAKVKKIKTNIKETAGLDPKMIRGDKFIKPLCLCGRLCDIRTIATIGHGGKGNSPNREKHLLFKSIIKLIHYRRKNKKLKPIIKKLNDDYIIYKKYGRDSEGGVSKVTINKKDKDIIKLYTDYLRPINENETHQPREPYIERVEYTEDYKDAVFILRHEINYLTQSKI